jgi:hypothetical protein
MAPTLDAAVNRRKVDDSVLNKSVIMCFTQVLYEMKFSSVLRHPIASSRSSSICANYSSGMRQWILALRVVQRMNRVFRHPAKLHGFVAHCLPNNTRSEHPTDRQRMLSEQGLLVQT